MLNLLCVCLFFLLECWPNIGEECLINNGKGSNADKVQDSETSMLVSNKADKTAKENYLEDSETTPKSCLGLVFELLATTACTSYSNSLSKSVRFLSLNYKLKDIDQLCCEKKRKDCGSPWSIQMHTFWCNNKHWRILAPNRTKLISLLSLLPAWWIPRITFLELFWSCFSYALVLLPRLFALVANFDGQCVWYAALFPIFALVANFDAQWM